MKKKKPAPFKFSPKAQKEFDEIKAEREKISAFVMRAQYKKAFLLAEKTLEKHPSNRFAIYKFAVALGDSESFVSKPQHLKNQKSAAKILKKVLRKTRGVDPRWVKVWRNEYYWFSKQPYRQYRLGIDHVKSQGKGSYYSAGVGAATLAHKLYGKNQFTRGKRWAKKSIDLQTVTIYAQRDAGALSQFAKERWGQESNLVATGRKAE